MARSNYHGTSPDKEYLRENAQKRARIFAREARCVVLKEKKK